MQKDINKNKKAHIYYLTEDQDRKVKEAKARTGLSEGIIVGLCIDNTIKADEALPEIKL